MPTEQGFPEEQAMNKDVFEGKWKQFRGEVKMWWGVVTNDELEWAAGKLDVFTGLLQERYGYTRQLSTEKIARHMIKYETSPKKRKILSLSK